MHNFVEEIKASFGCKFRESSVTHFLSDFICFAENKKSKSTDRLEDFHGVKLNFTVTEIFHGMKYFHGDYKLFHCVKFSR